MKLTLCVEYVRSKWWQTSPFAATWYLANRSQCPPRPFPLQSAPILLFPSRPHGNRADFLLPPGPCSQQSVPKNKIAGLFLNAPLSRLFRQSAVYSFSLVWRRAQRQVSGSERGGRYTWRGKVPHVRRVDALREFETHRTVNTGNPSVSKLLQNLFQSQKCNHGTSNQELLLRDKLHGVVKGGTY